MLEKHATTWSYFNNQISCIDKEITNSLKDEERLLMIYRSAPGIGPKTSSQLINELDDMSQFSNINKLFSNAGFTPREHSSGESVRRGHISKHGNPVVRKLMVEAAWKAIKIDSSLESIFEKISRRAGKKRAIVAVARVLLGRIYTCIKENRLYVIPEKGTCSEKNERIQCNPT